MSYGSGAPDGAASYCLVSFAMVFTCGLAFVLAFLGEWSAAAWVGGGLFLPLFVVVVMPTKAREPQPGSEEALGPRPELRCAYCHDDAFSELLASCPGCQTLIHAACLIEAGACPTLGCTGEPRHALRGRL